MAGITADQLVRLQIIQNAAARLIARKYKYDHFTPILYELTGSQLFFGLHSKYVFWPIETLRVPYHLIYPQFFAPINLLAHSTLHLKNCLGHPGLP